MYEITDDKSPTEVPVVKPWAAGKLDDSARTFDLVVTGNCAAGGSLKLDIKPGATRPDFFHIDENSGNLVYAEPQPMTIITMPKGHSASVMISLSDISHKTEMTDKVKNYICLGIKKKGVISDEILYGDTTHASILIDMYSEDVVELVPLLSTTALFTGGYTRAVPGSEATLVTGSIDFSSVYRVNVEATKSESADPDTPSKPVDPDTPMDVKWSGVQDCHLDEVYEGDTTWCNYGAMGVGPIKVGDTILKNQLLAVSYSGNLAYSSNGIDWKPYGSILNTEGETWGEGHGPVYGNGMWCVAQWYGSRIKYLRDGENEWKSFAPLPNNIKCLAFGKDMFMAITESQSNNVYVLGRDDTEWKQPTNEGLRTVTGYSGEILIYNKGEWVCSDSKHDVLEYFNAADSSPYWNSNSVTFPQYGSNAWRGRCYAYRYFYSIFVDKDIARLSNEGSRESWISCGNAGFSDVEYAYNITLYNDKLYAFSNRGTHFIVGTFIKPEPTTEPKS